MGDIPLNDPETLRRQPGRKYADSNQQKSRDQMSQNRNRLVQTGDFHPRPLNHSNYGETELVTGHRSKCSSQGMAEIRQAYNHAGKICRRKLGGSPSHEEQSNLLNCICIVTVEAKEQPITWMNLQQDTNAREQPHTHQSKNDGKTAIQWFECFHCFKPPESDWASGVAANLVSWLNIISGVNVCRI